jgi:hypothetical protein
MLKQQRSSPNPQRKSSTKSPLHTSQRTKVWKKKYKKKQDGDFTGPTNTQPRHLQYEIRKRVEARQGLTLQQIRPKYEFKILPNKENNYYFEPTHRLPIDLKHRILSYMDQFETPVRPKQILRHFIEHPTNPVDKDSVYKGMRQLCNQRNVFRIKKIDEEGSDHWFMVVAGQARIRHNIALTNMIKKKQPLPLDEVVWENFDNYPDSWANFREMSAEQKVIFEAKRKQQINQV